MDWENSDMSAFDHSDNFRKLIVVQTIFPIFENESEC